MTSLATMEQWLDGALATESAHIDRLLRNKRTLQRIIATKNERERLREAIQQLEVEDERQRRLSLAKKTPASSSSRNPAPKIEPKQSEPVSQANNEEGEDVSLLLPKQLESILALAQNTREGKVSSAKSSAATSTNDAAGSEGKRPVDMVAMRSKYKVMAPNPSAVPAPPTVNVDKPKKNAAATSDVKPLAAFVSEKEVSFPVNPELEEARSQINNSPKFQALAMFDEQLSILGRVRIANKIRFPTLKSSTTDKLYQAQLGVLYHPSNVHQSTFSWFGEAGESLFSSVLALAPFATRQMLRVCSRRLSQLLKAMPSSPAVPPTMVGAVQQIIRRIRLMMQQLKGVKRVPPAAAKEMFLLCLTLYCWQNVLVDLRRASSVAESEVFPLADGGDVNGSVGNHNIWASEMALAQDGWSNLFDRSEFELTEVPTKTTNPRSKSEKSSTADQQGMNDLEAVLLQRAAAMQVHVASVVKYHILKGFLRYSIERGIRLEPYERFLQQSWNTLSNGYDGSDRGDANSHDIPSRLLGLTRQRTTIGSAIEWVEFLKGLKLVHTIIAHDSATWSTCLFVPK